MSRQVAFFNASCASAIKDEVDENDFRAGMGISPGPWDIFLSYLIGFKRIMFTSLFQRVSRAIHLALLGLRGSCLRIFFQRVLSAIPGMLQAKVEQVLPKRIQIARRILSRSPDVVQNASSIIEQAFKRIADKEI